MLYGSETNLLWRNALLALSLRWTGYAESFVVVLACEGDEAARRAVDGVSKQHRDPASLSRATSHERLLSAFERMPAIAEWAAEFHKRYLDLTPVRR